MADSINEKIARFEHMAAADPTNEMAHFSLGSAYQQVGRHAEAAKSFEKCLALNPEMSKAYQMAGEAMIAAGWADKAVAVLNKGYEVAARKGDNMPKQAIATLLEKIGRKPPTIAGAASATESKAGTFICQRTGRPGTRLAEPPMRGPLGKWIQENISAETWKQWIGQGTKVINELRLDFSREQDQQTYDNYMYEFLGLDEETRQKLSGGKEANV
jgi:Fe-S cluster biosynthesis and repair protein YggX